MGTIIEFPIDIDPEPFRPASAVRRILDGSKCDAKLDSKIPGEFKEWLERQAYVSDQSLSRLTCMIIAEHIHNQRLHGLQIAGKKEEAA